MGQKQVRLALQGYKALAFLGVPNGQSVGLLRHNRDYTGDKV